MIEDEMVGWHHWFNRHEFEQALGAGDGRGSLTCCSQWGHKELAWLSNWTELYWTEITADGDCRHEIRRCLLLGRKVMTNLDNIFKSRHCFANKGPSSQGYGFSSGHVWMWELDCEESWEPKNCCFWTVVLEKTLESPLDYKVIQPVHPKRCQSWVFTGRTDVEAETQYFGHLMWRADSFEKIWCWERLRAGGEGDDRGWGGWMASLIQ